MLMLKSLPSVPRNVAFKKVIKIRLDDAMVLGPNPKDGGTIDEDTWRKQSF